MLISKRVGKHTRVVILQPLCLNLCLNPTSNLILGRKMIDTVDNNTHSISSMIIIGRKSWVTYIGASTKTILYLIIFYLIFYIIDNNTSIDIHRNIEIGVFSFVVICLVYRFLILRSYKVRVNEEGIWVHYGIFPWAKGGDGIRFQDVDMAKYFPNFFSWCTNSYKIVVQHKFTNSTDFSVTDIWRGRHVCNLISNEIRRHL